MTTKVKIPFGKGAMVEIEGTFDEVKTTLEKIDSLFTSLNTALGSVEVAVPPVTILAGEQMPTASEQVTTDVPILPVEAKKSLSESIVGLMKSPWGKAGRSYNEINKALEENTIYKSSSSLTGTLFTLAKGNKISRKKTSSGLMYFPPAY